MKKENKQGCCYELTQQITKGYSLYDVHLGPLLQTSLGLIPLIFFTSFSTFSGEALVSGWPWPLSLSLFLPFSTVPAYSILGGYVHE